MISLTPKLSFLYQVPSLGSLQQRPGQEMQIGRMAHSRAFPVVCHVGFIVIPGKILLSGNKIPIVKPGISLNRISLNRGSAPYILL